MPSDKLKPRVFYGPRVAGRKVTDGVAVQLNVIAQLGINPATRPYDFEGRTVDFSVFVEEDPDSSSSTTPRSPQSSTPARVRCTDSGRAYAPSAKAGLLSPLR